MTHIGDKKYKLGHEVADSYQEYREELIKQGKDQAYDPWTEEADRELVRLKDVKGLSTDELSKHFQRTEGSIKSRVKKLNLEGKWIEFLSRPAPHLGSEEMSFIGNIINGVNPNTGKLFPDDSVWLHPQMQKDILAFLQSIDEGSE